MNVDPIENSHQRIFDSLFEVGHAMNRVKFGDFLLKCNQSCRVQTLFSTSHQVVRDGNDSALIVDHQGEQLSVGKALRYNTKCSVEEDIRDV